VPVSVSTSTRRPATTSATMTVSTRF
jgi:hypothetical protein